MAHGVVIVSVAVSVFGYEENLSGEPDFGSSQEGRFGRENPLVVG